MIYPAQTSLIPVQIALAKFLETNGFAAIFNNYPYWYLGTTPYRYLTGPILPTALVSLHKAFPQLSLFTIYYLLITAAWLLGALGVYLLVSTLMRRGPPTADSPTPGVGRETPGVFLGRGGSRNRTAGVSALLYLFGPLVPLLFPFSDGLSLISFSFLPFVLLLYARFLKNPKPSFLDPSGLALGAAISFLLLLNISIIPALFIGMAAIFLAVTGWEHAEEKLKRSLLLTVYCLLFTTLWYTPGFWLARLGVPSLAGRHLIQVVLDLSKLLPAALAITAAFVSVKFFKKRNILRDFAFYWLFIFGFLTLIRFISDPDFWLDWLSYSTELQLGLAVGMGLWLGQRSPYRKAVTADVTEKRNGSRNRNRLTIAVVFALYTLIFALTANRFVVRTLQPDITQTVEYRIGLKLAEIIGAGESADHGARVLLSGTTAFWLNSLDFCPDRGDTLTPLSGTLMNAEKCVEIAQVRGGVDQASVDPNWRRAVWEVREGTDPEKSLEWLRTLNVSYLVVHTEDSEEYYHDFTYPEKFEGAAGFEKIYDVGGNQIYRILD